MGDGCICFCDLVCLLILYNNTLNSYNCVWFYKILMKYSDSVESDLEGRQLEDHLVQCLKNVDDKNYFGHLL